MVRRVCEGSNLKLPASEPGDLARSKRKTGLKDDVSGARCGAAELAVGERLRLVEERREQDAVWCAQVDHVEDVVGAGNEREIEAARCGGIETNGCATAAETAAADAATFARVVGLAFARILDTRTDADDFADANVKDCVGRTGADVVGNDQLIFAGGISVEASVLRGDDVSSAAGAVSWAGVELVVASEVAADGEVVRSAGLRGEQCCDAECASGPG